MFMFYRSCISADVTPLLLICRCTSAVVIPPSYASSHRNLLTKWLQTLFIHSSTAHNFPSRLSYDTLHTQLGYIRQLEYIHSHSYVDICINTTFHMIAVKHVSGVDECRVTTSGVFLGLCHDHRVFLGIFCGHLIRHCWLRDTTTTESALNFGSVTPPWPASLEPVIPQWPANIANYMLYDATLPT